jgi:5-hydroxyisourate hydrolase
MTTLSTHVLDTRTGLPASGLAVRLEDASGATLAVALTDRDGRVDDLRPAAGGAGRGGATGGTLAPGVYRLVFDTASYFGGSSLYPEVAVTVAVTDQPHLHLPLLLSGYAYTTYRGS